VLSLVSSTLWGQSSTNAIRSVARPNEGHERADKTSREMARRKGIAMTVRRLLAVAATIFALAPAGCGQAENPPADTSPKDAFLEEFVQNLANSVEATEQQEAEGRETSSDIPRP